ncbi:hypothetical protein D3C72_1510540 [compost metagenome]
MARVLVPDGLRARRRRGRADKVIDGRQPRQRPARYRGTVHAPGATGERRCQQQHGRTRRWRIRAAAGQQQGQRGGHQAQQKQQSRHARQSRHLQHGKVIRLRIRETAPVTVRQQGRHQRIDGNPQHGIRQHRPVCPIAQHEAPRGQHHQQPQQRLDGDRGQHGRQGHQQAEISKVR